MNENIKEHPLIKELVKYSFQDIYFLKSKWRQWIKERKFHNFEAIDQKPNVQSVYAILDVEKIISVESAREGFSSLRTKHSKEFDIVIIARIQDKKIEVMTYYKEAKQRHSQPQN